nr:FHA domain protein [uncultured bacterium]
MHCGRRLIICQDGSGYYGAGQYSGSGTEKLSSVHGGLTGSIRAGPLGKTEHDGGDAQFGSESTQGLYVAGFRPASLDPQDRRLAPACGGAQLVLVQSVSTPDEADDLTDPTGRSSLSYCSRCARWMHHQYPKL